MIQVRDSGSETILGTCAGIGLDSRIEVPGMVFDRKYNECVALLDSFLWYAITLTSPHLFLKELCL